MKLNELKTFPLTVTSLSMWPKGTHSSISQTSVDPKTCKIKKLPKHGKAKRFWREEVEVEASPSWFLVVNNMIIGGPYKDRVTADEMKRKRPRQGMGSIIIKQGFRMSSDPKNTSYNKFSSTAR